MANSAAGNPSPRPLKIAFVSSGRNQFIRPYLNYFRQRGHEVILISYDSFDTDRPSEYPIYDVSFGADARQQGTKWRYLLAAVKARKLLRQLKPDILHGHYVTSSGVICLLSGFRPYLVSARGSDLIGSMGSPVWRTILRQIFRKSSLVHTVSDELSAKAKELGVSEDRLMTLTQGVDTHVFGFKPPMQTLERPVKLICTRSLGEVYDPAVIVRACAMLEQSGVPFELTFAAGGAIEHEIKTLAGQCGLEGKITFMGGYTNDRLPEILKHYDIYLSASKWDGTSVSLLEAMSVGLFPVVSRITANLAWVEDGRTALMFDCGSERQLADAIRRAVEDNTLRVSAIEANRRLIMKKADRSANMQTLENKYYEILGM